MVVSSHEIYWFYMGLFCLCSALHSPAALEEVPSSIILSFLRPPQPRGTVCQPLSFINYSLSVSVLTITLWSACLTPLIQCAVHSSGPESGSSKGQGRRFANSSLHYSRSLNLSEPPPPGPKQSFCLSLLSRWDQRNSQLNSYINNSRMLMRHELGHQQQFRLPLGSPGNFLKTTEAALPKRFCCSSIQDGPLGAAQEYSSQRKHRGYHLLNCSDATELKRR
ncbi:uncharacterized protein LOC128929808 isoform X1 [Callithrix jacchus]